MYYVLVLVFIVVLLFLVGGCTLSCKDFFTKKQGIREGYKRACLGGECYGMQRSPVDYAMKYPNGWQRNPHYQTYPADEHQPLDFGPIDFHSETRRLNHQDGILFQQYGNNWPGCGRMTEDMANDEKNRFNLTNIGDQGARRVLDDMYNPRFGPPGKQFTERSLEQVNPYFDKLYGGARWLVHTKLGN